MFRRAVLVSWALATAAAPAALAQQRYTLKPTFTVGERWAMTRTNTFEMNSSVLVNGAVAQQSQQSSREQFDLEWEVLAVENGAPSRARVAFSPNCATQVSQDGQQQTIKFPAAGVTLEAQKRPDGGVDIQPASANTPEVVAILTEQFDPDTGAYPQQPIAVGETWQWDAKTIAETFSLSPNDKGAITCTLKGVTNRNGRETAQVGFNIQLEKGEAQEGPGQRITMLTKMTLTGDGMIDIPSGRLVELKIGGDAVVSGMVYGQNQAGQMEQQADLSGNGRMAMETHSRLVSASTSVTPTPTPMPVAGGVDFAGEYNNPELTLTLAVGPGGFTGKLKMGQREFPVQATANGNALTGKFQSDGNWFDFQATLNGNTLSLTTGGKTHTLTKKTTAQNPLGGNPAPNPLGREEKPNPLGGGSGGGSIERPTPAPFGTSNNTNNRPVQSERAVGVSYAVFRCLDQQGFRDAAGQPLEVFRMLMPQGWRFNGGLTWKINVKGVQNLSRVDLVNPVSLAFEVASPDSRVGILSYPEVHFADLRGSPAYDMGAFPEGSDYGGFTVCQTIDPATYITQFVIPRQRGGLQSARVVESKELPSLVNRYDREAAIVAGALQGLGSGISHRAAMVTVEHEMNGVPTHEVFVVVLGYLQTPGITMWSSRLNISMRAPQAEVERWRPVIATMLQSFEFNMRWVGEYLKVQQKAGGVIIDVDRFCQKVDAEITRNRAETNAQIQRDMYPRLAPFCDHIGADGKRYFLETDLQHQMNENGVIRSDISLPDQDGWTRMPEYTGP